jgi:hypothetical protein
MTGIFGELAAGHEGALPFGKLPVAYHTAQPFDVLVRPCPRPMRDIAFAGTIEQPRSLLRGYQTPKAANLKTAQAGRLDDGAACKALGSWPCPGS